MYRIFLVLIDRIVLLLIILFLTDRLLLLILSLIVLIFIEFGSFVFVLGTRAPDYQVSCTVAIMPAHARERASVFSVTSPGR